MLLVQSILLILSIIVLSLLAVFVATRSKIMGATDLFMMILAVLIWSLCAFMELQASDVAAMLFWRDLQQVGVFLSPLATLWFAVRYTMNHRLMLFVWISTAFDAAALLLVFTDVNHHLMRKSFAVQHSELFGSVLVIKSTTLGTLALAFNFCLVFIAIIILLLFLRKLSRRQRKPLLIIIVSLVSISLLTLIKTAFLEDMGLYISMSVLHAPWMLLFSYALFRNEFLGLSPIARNKVFEVMDEGVLVLDENGTIIDFNSAAARLTREVTPTGDVKLGAHLYDLLPVPDACFIDDEARDERYETEIKLPAGGGCLSFKRYRLGRQADEPLGYVVVLTDISAQKDNEYKLRQMAQTDPLTGIFNREGIDHAYRGFQHLPCDSDTCVTVFIIDIDHFKDINDTYGHQTGDRVLKSFARTAQALLEGEGVLGRLGGDEFTMILPYLNLREACIIAERLLKAVQAADESVCFTVSIGVTGSPTMSRHFQSLLHDADIALYQAKVRGRNGIAVYFSEPDCSHYSSGVILN